jgi:hypothetical protein
MEAGYLFTQWLITLNRLPDRQRILENPHHLQAKTAITVKSHIEEKTGAEQL